MDRGQSRTLVGTVDMMCLSSPLHEPVYTRLPTRSESQSLLHHSVLSTHELSPNALHPSGAESTNCLSTLNLSFTVMLPLKCLNMFKTLFQTPALKHHHHCAVLLSFTSCPIFLRKFLCILSGFLRTHHTVL